MRLLGVELRRLGSRRVTWAALAVAVAALVLVLGKTAYDSRPPSAAERARAEQLASQAAAQFNLAEQQQRCAEMQRGAPEGVPPDKAGPDCSQIRPPQASDYLVDRTFRFASEITSRMVGFGVLLALLSFLVGASFVGAEWGAGTLPGLLLVEPGRSRVVLAKAGALLAGVALAGGLLLGAVLGGHYLVAALRGDLTGANVSAAALTGGRALVLGLTAGGLGFALAGSLRGTAVALGAGFAYFLGGEIVVRALLGRVDQWLFVPNVTALLNKGTKISYFVCDANRTCTDRTVTISAWQGTAYLLALVAVGLLAFLVTFRRRDLT